MQAKAKFAGSARSLELETDTATLKRMLAMIGGTVAIVGVLGVCGVMVASGAVSSYFWVKPYSTPQASGADKIANQLVMTCKIGAVALVASRDQARAAAGRELAGQCDEAGAVIRTLPIK